MARSRHAGKSVKRINRDAERRRLREIEDDLARTANDASNADKAMRLRARAFDMRLARERLEMDLARTAKTGKKAKR